MKRRAIVGSSVLILALLSLLAMAEGLLPSVPAALKGEECVEPVDVMRRQHMDFLLHQRDNTVHQGIREDIPNKGHSLIGCIDCHAQQDQDGQYLPVNAPGQFCQSCHSYAAVQIDCFQCHASKPASE